MAARISSDRSQTSADSFDSKTPANNPLLAELIQRVLIVGQQAIAIVTVAMIEVVHQALQISGVVMFKQRDAEGFLRAKVVVEGALGHLRRLQKFAQAHSGKTAMHAKLLAGGGYVLGYRNRCVCSCCTL